MVVWEEDDICGWLPRLQAHRGYWVEGLQQNSFQSVQEAFFKGYKMAEFDVRLTADEVVVLFHDEKYRNQFLDRTFYADFKKWIQPEFSDLSRLEDVLRWMQDQFKHDVNFDFKLNIEIKSKKTFDGRLERKVYELLKQFDLLEHVLISSFNPFALYRMRKFHKALRRALLLTHDHESNWVLNKMLLNFLARPHVLHVRWNDFSAKVVKQVGGKVPIVLWTVNDMDFVKTKRSEIHGVISDRITPTEFQKA